MSSKKTEKIKTHKKALFLTILSVVIIILITYYIVVVSMAPPAPSIPVSRQIFEVNDENDDGRTFTVEQNEKGYGNEYQAWALLQLSPSYSFGVKFDNITIPQGANLTKAFCRLYSIGGPGLQHPNCNIYCDNVDNAENFSIIGVLNISGRTYTQNSTVWNVTLPYGTWIQTPSVVSALQEVINRENWTSGNSVAVLFVTKGFPGYSMAFRNYGTGDPVKLYVEWEKP